MGEPIPRALTIRVGDQVLTDVADYVLLVRTKDNGIETITSSYCWADGAMRKALTVIEASNYNDSMGDGDE